MKGVPLQISDSNWMIPVSKRKRHLDGTNSIILPLCGLSGDLPVKGFPLQISDSKWMVPMCKPQSHFSGDDLKSRASTSMLPNINMENEFRHVGA